MPIFKHVKTNFTGGELAPGLYGRGDTRAYENGAKRLRNVVVDPTGGVSRRPGLRYIDNAFGVGRLISFEFNTEQVYLLAFCEYQMEVWKDGVSQATVVTPWAAADMPKVYWTQSADTLFLCHPSFRTRKITRTSHTSWVLTSLTFAAVATGSGSRYTSPHYKFADPAVTLSASATSGSGVTITSSAAVFTANHVGAKLRLNDREVVITAYTDSTHVTVTVTETLTGTTATTDWTEEAFSDERGWPETICFHQDRMVIGGSRSLPNRVWLSKAGEIYNFELGSGADGDAIEFTILSDQVNAIRALYSGRDLQIFTSGGEYIVTGEPLTPSSVQASRQTRVGSPVDRHIPPCDIDGSTVFPSRLGSTIREFVYSDTVAAYETPELSLLSKHLLSVPQEMDYDVARRLLYVINNDGTLAVCTVYKNEQVTAWQSWDIDGAFVSVAVVGENAYFLVEHNGGYFIALLDDALYVDLGISWDTGPSTGWSGFDHLEGEDVVVNADGVDVGTVAVTGGVVTTPSATEMQAGLPLYHSIIPLPPAAAPGMNNHAGKRVRGVRMTFQVANTSRMFVDAGLGATADGWTMALAGQGGTVPFTGEIEIGGVGWKAQRTPLWSVEGGSPLPLTILAVETEIAVND